MSVNCLRCVSDSDDQPLLLVNGGRPPGPLIGLSRYATVSEALGVDKKEAHTAQRAKLDQAF